ncbi:sterile alpha motif/pointed domain-containing protein [Syncephalis pseudoplumigaleata]|uniref:Sterile alpha motif/pointed domain-containing protein n=1 Tax=Syncephalis pseudoplumigaleata TaxID=1712513 RepID=A0A4P9YT31_9FUNG|nr:sterile alpha motif/pointed domain-containing protein [Syncephalis pseudoplumigaleata]|eukprot:RKP23047.1 sterile alpha motif/pointed domain-containing protein [Syncephalis pseudoplumigaleata]
MPCARLISVLPFSTCDESFSQFHLSERGGRAIAPVPFEPFSLSIGNSPAYYAYNGYSNLITATTTTTPLRTAFLYVNEQASSIGRTCKMHNHDVRSWSEQQVAAWLTENHFGHYVDTFIENDVDGQVLVELDNTLLKELGVPTVGERVKLMVALKKLRQACVNAARRALQEEAMAVESNEQSDATLVNHLHHQHSNSNDAKSSGDRLRQVRWLCTPTERHGWACLRVAIISI